MQDDMKLAFLITTLIGAILILLIVFGIRECDANETRKQDFMKTCVTAGKAPLECRASELGQ